LLWLNGKTIILRKHIIKKRNEHKIKYVNKKMKTSNFGKKHLKDFYTTTVLVSNRLKMMGKKLNWQHCYNGCASA